MLVDELDARVSAAFALRQLCEERIRVDLVAYGDKPPIEYSLIEQVQQAVEGFSFERGGSSSGRAGVPFDIGLSEMYSALCWDLRRAAIRQGLVEPSNDVDPVADARALLGGLERIPLAEVVEYSEAWSSWCGKIRGYLSPGRRTPLPGKTCPMSECQQSEWFTFDDDGHKLAEPALQAVWVDEQVDHVECRCCFSVWPRQILPELAEFFDPEALLRFLE